MATTQRIAAGVTAAAACAAALAGCGIGDTGAKKGAHGDGARGATKARAPRRPGARSV